MPSEKTPEKEDDKKVDFIERETDVLVIAPHGFWGSEKKKPPDRVAIVQRHDSITTNG